jgi:uncharacterized membrane protein
MDEFVLLGFITLALLFSIPWAAFSARSKAKHALAMVERQNAVIAYLRDEVALLRAGGIAPAQPAVGLATPEAEAAEPVIAPEPTAAEPTVASDPVISAPPPAAEPPPAADAIAARIADEITRKLAASVPEERLRAVETDEAPPVSPSPEEIAPPVFSSEAAPAAEPPKARDLEESIGSRWAVWVGGVALAFGGLFLVRYSIEQGFFGPGVRLLMGAAFAIAMAVGSEIVRRSDRRFSLGRLPPTQIPALLAGVSVLSGFGVVYAAHAIYGFIGPGPAFTLMGLIGLGALAASLIHGPMLGIFGLLGSYVTPFLVASSAPNFAALSIFIAVVTAAAFAIHNLRPNRAVTLGAVIGHSLWTLVIALAERGGGWSSFLIVAGAALGLGLLKEWPARNTSGDTASGFGLRGAAAFDRVSFAAVAAPLVISGIIWVNYGGPAGLLTAIIATVAIAVIGGVRHRDLGPLVPLAGAAATGMILLWPTNLGPIGVAPRLLLDLIRLDLAPNAAPGLSWTALLFAGIAGGLPFLALWRRYGAGDGDVVARGCLGFGSALAPVCLMLAAALRINGFERSTLFAAIALALTVLLFIASEIILAVERGRTKARANPLAFIGSAAYAAAAAIALGLAIAFALRETWLVVGFAVAAAGVAVVASLRPIPLLRSMSAALATAALGRLIWKPILTDVGTWPIFNWLIIAYALPTLCFAVAFFLLRDRDDRPRRVLEALAAFFGAAFVLLEVRQFFAGQDLIPTFALLDGHYDLRPRNRLFEEIATHVAALGVIGTALQVLHHRFRGRMFLHGADIAAMALFVAAIGGLGALLNPLLDGTAVNGPPVFNRLLGGYVLVGAILGALGFALKKKLARSRMTDALEAIAAVLVALGAFLIVRHAFAGPQLAAPSRYGVGFFECVMVAIVFLALACAARIWFEASGGRVIRFVMSVIAGVAIGWTIVTLGVRRNPFFDFSGVDGVIIFNRILWGYGAIALAFAGAGIWMNDAAPKIARALKLTSAASALLAAFLLLRHGFHGPLLHSEVPVTLAESGWYASMVFIAAIALMVAGSLTIMGRRIAVRPEAIAAASCAFFALICGVVANPFLTGAPLAGWIILDNALIGYLIPSMLAFVAARWSRLNLPAPLAARIFGLAAIAGGLGYLLIEVRRWFVGPDLLAFARYETELYAYSAAVILYGVALLVLGFRLGSKDLRLASLIVVALAVCKVFLVDMAGLEGLLRALSFIGLGASLVGIGLVYQRLLQRESLQRSPAKGAGE